MSQPIEPQEKEVCSSKQCSIEHDSQKLPSKENDIKNSYNITMKRQNQFMQINPQPEIYEEEIRKPTNDDPNMVSDISKIDLQKFDFSDTFLSQEEQHFEEKIPKVSSDIISDTTPTQPNENPDSTGNIQQNLADVFQSETETTTSQKVDDLIKEHSNKPEIFKLVAEACGSDTDLLARFTVRLSEMQDYDSASTLYEVKKHTNDNEKKTFIVALGSMQPYPLFARNKAFDNKQKNHIFLCYFHRRRKLNKIYPKGCGALQPPPRFLKKYVVDNYVFFKYVGPQINFININFLSLAQWKDMISEIWVNEWMRNSITCYYQQGDYAIYCLRDGLNTFCGDAYATGEEILEFFQITHIQFIAKTNLPYFAQPPPFAMCKLEIAAFSSKSSFRLNERYRNENSEAYLQKTGKNKHDYTQFQQLMAPDVRTIYEIYSKENITEENQDDYRPTYVMTQNFGKAFIWNSDVSIQVYPFDHLQEKFSESIEKEKLLDPQVLKRQTPKQLTDIYHQSEADLQFQSSLKNDVVPLGDVYKGELNELSELLKVTSTIGIADTPNRRLAFEQQQVKPEPKYYSQGFMFNPDSQTEKQYLFKSNENFFNNIQNGHQLIKQPNKSPNSIESCIFQMEIQKAPPLIKSESHSSQASSTDEPYQRYKK